jgi:hypothetical protein
MEKEELIQKFTFHYDNETTSEDVFYCKCGNKITKNRNEEVSEMKIDVKVGDDISDLTSILDENSMVRFSFRCDVCDTDYSTKQNAHYVQECNKQFYESYKLSEDETYITLSKHRFEGAVIEDVLQINESISYLKLNKDTKKITSNESNSSELDLNLDNVMSVVRNFFLTKEAKFTEGLFDVHLFLNRVVDYVIDSKNMNLVDELMKQMSGRAGLDILTKVVSIFFGIICYSNLSTIALTKGTIFLFDMMNECQLPNPQELSDNKATSPLKIFNYLVNNKNEEIMRELEENNTEKGYTYRNLQGKEFHFNYESSRFDKKSNIISDKSGNISLSEDIAHKSVSPYIFNAIKKFSDYKTLIKYTKFISYTQLIELVQKNDINILLNLLPVIEFRADMDIIKINQVVALSHSYLKRWNKIRANADLEELEFVRERVVAKNINQEQLIEYENIPLDYSHLEHFDLSSYDDSLRMIRNFSWDPQKEFYKIKDIDILEEYHDKISKEFHTVFNDSTAKDFVSFVETFKVLEEENFNNKLRVKLILTPENLLNAAKRLRNCAGSYVNRIADKQYVLCMIEDIDPKRGVHEPFEYMFGLLVNNYGELAFDATKSACNKIGSDRYKVNIMEYLQEKEIPYKELADLRLSTSGREI